ncbi:MAG: hypothetical protein K6E53_09980 [Lachnospiraceae bacterium]|nr:hypothetical protein [Lachnospiraceae bacterium]
MAYDFKKEYKEFYMPKRLHHEIYLSDARKVDPEKLKNVIRHPIETKGE